MDFNCPRRKLENLRLFISHQDTRIHPLSQLPALGLVLWVVGEAQKN